MLGIGLLLLAAGGFWWYRRDEPETRTRDGRVSEHEVTDPEREPNVVESLFDHATDHLESGDPDSAVQACYSAVRRQFASTAESERALTHWEFYRAYLDAGGDRTDGEEGHAAEALRDVTEAYEQAAYSPGTVSIDEASRAVEHAQRLCTRSDGGRISAESEGGER